MSLISEYTAGTVEENLYYYDAGIGYTWRARKVTLSATKSIYHVAFNSMSANGVGGTTPWTGNNPTDGYQAVKLFQANGADGRPGTLIATSESIYNVKSDPSWMRFEFLPAVELAAGDYWIAFLVADLAFGSPSPASGDNIHTWSTADAGTGIYSSSTNSGSTWSSPSNSGLNYKLYGADANKEVTSIQNWGYGSDYDIDPTSDPARLAMSIQLYDGANAGHYFWFLVTDGTYVQLNPSGNTVPRVGTGHRVDILSADNKVEVATKFVTVVNLVSGFSATNPDVGSEISVTNSSAGEATDASTDGNENVVVFIQGAVGSSVPTSVTGVATVADAADGVTDSSITLTEDMAVTATGDLLLDVSKLSDLKGNKVITVQPGGSVKLTGGRKATVLAGTLLKIRT